MTENGTDSAAAAAAEIAGESTLGASNDVFGLSPLILPDNPAIWTSSEVRFGLN